MMAQMVPLAVSARNETVVVTGSRIEAQALGDYKLYPLPEPTTVAAQQTKQVQFLDQSAIPFERIYRYSIDAGQNPEQLPNNASVVLRLQNRADKGLGKPLPAGNVSVFAPGSDGSFVFAGEHSVNDISVGLPVEVEIGRSMDVRIVPRLADSTSSGSGRQKKAKDSWEIAIENDKKAPITFEFRQDIYGSEAEIVSESRAHENVSGRAIWAIPLAAGERTILRYTIEHPA